MSAFATSTCTHPIWLLARTDAELTTLCHSFFILSINESKEAEVILRVPSNREGIDDIESGLLLFVKDIVDRSISDEWGTFAVTTSVGTRFFVSYRRSKRRFMLTVSYKIINLFLFINLHV